MHNIRSLAGLLNQECACFSLDVDALRQALHADSVLAEWWPHWQDTHAHLFSNNGLFISRAQLQAMQKAVQVLHATMTSPAWQAHALTHSPELARMAAGRRQT